MTSITLIAPLIIMLLAVVVLGERLAALECAGGHPRGSNRDECGPSP